ncbi:MAG: hypothetical protein DMG61_07080 [Acidobacteria bacterium]|nr:MAG: hypothetical protein DMG61_07080 [Acidobacteriota bacterium]
MKKIISRRAFIGTGLAAPLILHAQDKAGIKAPILGSGEWTFAWVGDWGDLPSHIKWGNTHNVAEDSHGNIYVHHNIAIAPKGDLYVADGYGSYFINHYNHKGEYIPRIICLVASGRLGGDRIFSWTDCSVKLPILIADEIKPLARSD